ncbi:MAG: histidine phosphatase family protein [Bacillota bacterium]
MIKLYFIRHAQAANQTETVPGVHPNPHLSETGFQQAQKLAEKLKELKLDIDVLYSSSMLRALDTAKIIHEKLKIPWQVWPALIETGRRDWPKLRGENYNNKEISSKELSKVNEEEHFLKELYPALSELKNYYPDINLSQPFDWPDLWWIPMYKEKREKAYARANKVINSFKAKYLDDDITIAVVSHAAFGSVLFTIMLGSKPCDYNRYSFENASISRLDLDKEKVILRFHNYIFHCSKI